ncbi:hypothetical protein AVENLUH5627_00115 [Acinetobacter venetianus]|uniref:Uncharacterized protein n=1 Tax=Acinetobacter venetianus TaxID=52133 RepID=A0A150I2X2_9GAMM|nr:hypothetical protein [Acinetobacter venetianus]KXZ74180.1 hypothetical protein AVENLUH5627_00115 [Acinetobacter venetianus]
MPSPYVPPKRSHVSISLTDISQSAKSRVSVSINLTPEQQSGEAQYVGGDGWGLNSSLFGQSRARLQFQRISNPSIGNTLLVGTPGVFNQRDFISPSGINLNTYGRPTIYNLNRYIVGRGLSSFISGSANVQSTLAYIRPTGLNSFSPGTAKALSSKIEAKGFNSFTAGQPKIESLRAYIRAGAYDFFVSGKIRISYKEQHATTTQKSESTLWGKSLVAYGVRYVEQNSPSPLTRFGTAWASFSPRYIEPRGIFQQFPSYHRIGGSQTVKMEGFDFLRFGTRIIPENQAIFPIGFSTLFGDHEIRNNLHPIKPKGFLTAGEQIGMRFGHVTAFNSTQYLLPFHDDTSKAAGPLFPDIKQHEIANLNRVIQTHGRINTQFGYADLVNKARVIYPVGLASPLEVEPTKTLVADGIRYIKPGSIEAPRMSTWHNIWLGAQNKRVQGPVLTLYGVPYIENTRRIYRFISLGEQTLFGKGMISHAVRGIRIQEDYSIAPPVIPMPEVKLGVRYVEPSSIDSVRYGWPHLAEKFTKIAPHWVQINRVGEPVIRNVTPQARPWQFESAKYGTAYVGLYTRHIKPDGLSAQQFSRARISDRKQGVDLRSYGIQPPTITKLHKIENVGAGQLLPHVIYPIPITTANFEIHPDKLHTVRQNVIRPESEKPMTMFGDTRIHANSIRVEPGYWEILMGKPLVEHKNRKIHMDSTSCDFLGISKPRMSPHTIWAVVEAPNQARENHVRPDLPLHYVDGRTESGNTKYPGIEIGTPRISHKNRRLNPPGYLAFGIGKPTIYNVVTKIEPKGWISLRLGVLGPIGDQHISFRPKDPMTQWGLPNVVSIIRHDGKLKPAGLVLTEIGEPVIDFYHRSIKPVGLHSMAMGTIKQKDQPYLWQGLRVGAHVPTKIGGLDGLRFGTAWISYRVREAVMKGDDFAAVSEYEPGKFNLKMTIRNAKQPEYPRTQQVITKGDVLSLFGTPDSKLKLHFIRPDGNSDNFRKGGL